MQTSANYGLKLFEGTDNVKRQDFVDNFQNIDSTMKSIDNSKTPLYRITSATDFNTLTTSGIYYIKAAGCTNTPTGNWGTLFVSNEGTMFQIFICDNATTVYKRIYSSSAWGAWLKIADNLGNYLALTGGALTGALTGTTIAATGGFTGSLNGNARTATTLQTARNISITGGATGTATAFNGGADISIPVTALDATKLTGTAAVSTTGNAATATKLQTARTINGVNFDGSANITVADSTKLPLSGGTLTGGLTGTTIAATSFTGPLTGNAATATKLATARNIALTGEVTGNANFDGSGNVSISATVADNSHNHTIANVTNLQSSLDTINANAAQLSNPNLLINGDFQVWQRGINAAITANTNIANYLCVDRWKFSSKPTQNIVISKTDTGTLKIVIPDGTVNNNGASQYILAMTQLLENPPFNKQHTISIRFKQSIANGLNSGGNRSAVINAFATVSFSDTWDSSGNVLWIDFTKAGTYEIESIKLELGSIATPLSPRTYAEELAMCQRYYEKGFTIYGYMSANYITGSLKLSPKRTKPTVLLYSSSNKNLGKVSNYATGNETTGTLTVRLTDDSENGAGCSYNGIHAIMSSINDFTSGSVYAFYWTADSEIF